MRERLIILLLLVCFTNGIIWASIVPIWQAPDEKTYFGEIKMIAQDHKVPGIMGERMTSHPQLYPVAAAPFFLLGSPGGNAGRLLSLRFFGVLLTLVVVYCGYATAEIAFPGNRFVPPATASLMSLHPQFIFIMSSVNSDALLNAFAALFFWRSAILIRRGISLKRISVLILVTVGGLLTKERFWFAVVLLGIFAPIVLVKDRLRRRVGESRPLVRDLLAFASSLIAMLLILVAVAFNGFIKPHYFRAAGRIINQAVNPYFTDSMFKYFWGHFGWLNISMTDYVYKLLAFLAILSVLGGVYALVDFIRRAAFAKPAFIVDQLTVDRATLMGYFIISIILVYLAMAAYQVLAGGAQGRYLFVVLIPIFTLLSWGLSKLIPRRFWPYAFTGLFGGMLALNMVALYNVVIPYYY